MVDTSALKCLAAELDHLLDQGRRRLAAGNTDIKFLEQHDALRGETLAQISQDLNWFGDVHQDQPPDDGIDRGVEPDSGNVLLHDIDIREVRFLHARTRGRDCFGRLIDGDNLASWADTLGKELGHIAGAASGIEHAHPGFDAGDANCLFGERRVEISLPAQAGELTFFVTEEIRVVLGGGCVHGGCSCSDQ
jgi:hypothetical protein